MNYQFVLMLIVKRPTFSSARAAVWGDKGDRFTLKSNASPRSWNPIPTDARFPPSPSTLRTKYLELSKTGSTCVYGET